MEANTLKEGFVRMETIEKQLLDLHEKVDRLYEIIERLNSQFTVVFSESQMRGNAHMASGRSQVGRSANPLTELESFANHKDILHDDSTAEMMAQSLANTSISPESQLQRLTAQLTAAYNRIAALEEQLVTHRSRH
jgi:chaperonin cofactor prefoldin